MSSDALLKRLGLDHLKDDPKALKEALDKAVRENEARQRAEERERLEALKDQKKQ